MSNGKTKRVVYKKGENIESFAKQFITKEKKKKTILKVPKDLWNTPAKGYTGVLTTNVKDPTGISPRITGKPYKLSKTKSDWIETSTPTFKERRKSKIASGIGKTVGYGVTTLGGLKTLFGSYIK